MSSCHLVSAEDVAIDSVTTATRRLAETSAPFEGMRENVMCYAGVLPNKRYLCRNVFKVMYDKMYA